MAEATIPDHRASSRPFPAGAARETGPNPTHPSRGPMHPGAPPCPCQCPCTQAVPPCVQAAAHTADEAAQQGHVARQVARRSKDQCPADPHQERTCMGTRCTCCVVHASMVCICAAHAHAAHAHAAHALNMHTLRQGAMRRARRRPAGSTSMRHWCWPPPRTSPPRRARRASGAPARTRRRFRPRPRPAPATTRAHPPLCAHRARTPACRTARAAT